MKLMVRKTKEREELEKLSDRAQKVFKILGVKSTQGFLGLTFTEINEELLRKHIAFCNDDISLALGELVENGFVVRSSTSKGFMFQLTDKGDTAFL